MGVMKMKEKINSKNLEKLLIDSKCQILATNNGVMINGRSNEILTLLACIIDTIESKTVVSKEMLKTAILVGLDKNDDEESTEDTVDIILKNLMKILD